MHPVSSLAPVSTDNVLPCKVLTVPAETDYDTLRKEFGARLRTLLEQCELTQAELARLGHKNPSEISRYVRGEVLPKPPTQIEIGRILDVTVGYLVYGEDQ